MHVGVDAALSCRHVDAVDKALELPTHNASNASVGEGEPGLLNPRRLQRKASVQLTPNHHGPNYHGQGRAAEPGEIAWAGALQTSGFASIVGASRAEFDAAVIHDAAGDGAGDGGDPEGAAGQRLSLWARAREALLAGGRQTIPTCPDGEAAAGGEISASSLPMPAFAASAAGPIAGVEKGAPPMSLGPSAELAIRNGKTVGALRQALGVEGPDADPAWLLRLLVSSHWDVETAARKGRANLRWREANRMDDVAERVRARNRPEDWPHGRVVARCLPRQYVRTEAGMVVLVKMAEANYSAALQELSAPAIGEFLLHEAEYVKMVLDEQVVTSWPLRVLGGIQPVACCDRDILTHAMQLERRRSSQDAIPSNLWTSNTPFERH